MSVSKDDPNLMHSSQDPHLTLGLTVVLVITVGVRLVVIGCPLLGNFATKNVVYAMIARNLVEGRASFWLPRLDCLCGGERGLHLVELPLSAYLAGGLWKLLGGSLDVWGRTVSIGLSVASVVILFDLVRRRHGPSAALGAAMVLALSPVAVIYGQCFMLEASVVFLTVAVIGALDRWLSGRQAVWLLVAACCFALLVLTKIYMLVLLLPIGYMLLIESHGRGATGVSPVLSERQHGQDARGTRQWLGVGLFCMACLPAVGWVFYVIHVASPGARLADQVFYSLLDSAEAHRPPHPLLGQVDFYRRLFDDLAGVVLTPVGFMLPLVGLLDRTWRRYVVWLLAMALLVVAMPRKFYEMNYYYVVLLPPIAILAGLGYARLAERLRPSRMAVAALVALALVVSLRYTAGPLLMLPEEDRAVLPAARAAGALAAEDEPVVTMHGSGIDLLYYCNRPGWALEPDQPELARRLSECRRAGGRLLVIVDVEAQESPEGAGRLAPMTPIAEGPGFRIYRISDGQ